MPIGLSQLTLPEAEHLAKDIVAATQRGHLSYVLADVVA